MTISNDTFVQQAQNDPAQHARLLAAQQRAVADVQALYGVDIQPHEANSMPSVRAFVWSGIEVDDFCHKELALIPAVQNPAKIRRRPMKFGAAILPASNTSAHR